MSIGDRGTRREALNARRCALQFEREAIAEALMQTALVEVDAIRSLAGRLKATKESLLAVAMELESLHEGA